MAMTSSIIWKNANNSVGIMKPVESARLVDETDADFLNRIAALFAPVGWRIILDSAIPADADYLGSLVVQAAAMDLAKVANINAMSWQDVRMSVPADVTTTSNVPSDITGLSFPIGANEKWTIRLTLFCNGSTAGMKFQMVGPAAPVSVKVGADGNTTAVTARTLSMVAALSTLTAAFIANATPFTGKVEITARIINGPTAGTLKFQLASTTNGQTNKVLTASFGKAERDG